MRYRSLKDCVADLEKTGQLKRVNIEVDPCLEIAEIQRRLYRAQGPAVLFTNVRGCRFPMLANLFGTKERTRFLFRDTLDKVRQLVDLKIDPLMALKHPVKSLWSAPSAWNMLPKHVSSGAVLKNKIRIQDLPQLKSWPDDGGAFLTLPQVYSEDADAPGLMKSNLGMYRIQLSGNQYQTDAQVGLHYQIHRSIGVHHAKAIAKGEPFRVNIFLGGTPAMTLAAVMPLPEGMSELMFGGALGGGRIRMVKSTEKKHPAIYADADFCITGTVDPNLQLPEGPFGDHLGYYSLKHNFPVLNVESVTHRDGAIFPFTVVGRPPQEDTSFGELIHEITGPIIPTVIAGVHAIHAVDASGVHPLLLAQGSERYVPYAAERTPQELLTCANAILGQGQLSLAKYLFIVAKEDAPDLNINDIPAFFKHVLERVDWSRDLHFQTRTTIDTLDYTGSGFNEGSKVVIAAAGSKKRTLPTQFSSTFNLPSEIRGAEICLPGIVAMEATGVSKTSTSDAIQQLATQLPADHPLHEFPLWLVVDDCQFAAAHLNNWIWMTFTRSNPAADIFGVDASTHDKHWGCNGALIIDARIKPHHAPPLIEDVRITQKVDALAAQGAPLEGLF